MGDAAEIVDAYADLVDARGAYKEARVFADGEKGDIYASRRVRVMLQTLGVEAPYDLNYCAIPIRVITDRLDLAAPTSGDKQLLAAAQAFHRQHRLGIVAQVTHIMASTYGDAYIYAEEDPEGAILRVNNPESVRAIYTTADPIDPVLLVKAWEDTDPHGKPVIRANLYYPDSHIEKWVTKPGALGKLERDWLRYPEDPEDIELPGRLPFFHFRNNWPYGTPEHRSIYGAQLLVNKLVVTHAATVDFQGFPQRYYMADPKMDDPLENLDDPDYPEDEYDDPEGPDGRSALSAHPSSVWKLYGRSAGQFTSADAATFMTPLDRYIQSMSELSGLPAHHFKTVQGQTPSGAALRVLDKPTDDIVGKRQRVYGEEWSELYRHMLNAGPEADLGVRWRPLRVIDDPEWWQTVELKRRNGVPLERLLIESGYSPEEATEWAKTAPPLPELTQGGTNHGTQDRG
jgi:hypothetical protein